MENKFDLPPISNRIINKREGEDSRFGSIEEQTNSVAEYFNSEIEEEKTTEDILVINSYNNYLQKEIKLFGITVAPILEEKIKFFTTDNFNKLFEKEDKTAGGYIMEAGLICLKKNGLETFHTLMHEMIHYYSFHKINLDENDKLYQVARVGYNEYDARNFVGLNEGLTELIVSKILSGNIKDIKDNISYFGDKNVSEEDKESFFKPIKGRYSQFSSMLLRKLSEKELLPEDDLLKKFEEGMFTGEMMHLREIEKMFGKNSLRILAYYDIYEDKDIDRLVYDYFNKFESDEKSGQVLENLENIRKGTKE
ncbi:MAG: hypothetical protein ACM3PZ_02170 [Bacillota bacterium]